jgi:hypothetical protein
VLDAGYFDDYGISIALAYLDQKDVLDWIDANTSGVVLVQINAFPRGGQSAPSAAKGARDCSLPVESGFGSWFGKAVEPISSPLSGLFSSREASMTFRNDQEIETLKRVFDEKHIPFDRVVFVNSARASFSWYLPKRDLDCMRDELNARDNKDAFDKLASIWSGGWEPVSDPLSSSEGAVPAPQPALDQSATTNATAQQQ